MTPTSHPPSPNGFTAEQKEYLQGLFAGQTVRGLAFRDIVAAPGQAEAPAAPRIEEELIFEERVKKELHPLDAYSLILEHALANKTPERENIYRFKWNGLFFLTPMKEAFMARLRIPAGQLKTFQVREIAKITNELTTGYIQITTRANLQIRLIEPKNTPEFLQRIQSVGLHTRGAGADNVRNLTASATSGIDPYELIDVAPLCHQLGQIIINNREFYNLPRKFNVAFDGGGMINSLEDTNDIGVTAVKINEGGTISPGVYFRLALGGATGHQKFAHDLGVLVRPEDVVKVIMAAIRVYMANGNRSDRKKARLKHLLDTWSLEKYLGETEKLLGMQLLRAPLDECGDFAFQEKPSLPNISHPHVGVFPQKQRGLNYVGVALPAGQVTAKQLIRIAELADNYGSGEIRLTVWQNFIIPNVPDAFIGTVKKSLVKMGLHWQQSNVRSGIVACTGNSYCKFASSNTKGHALELAAYLEKKLALDEPVNIHLTGCPNSCAQHYIGDIGLLGTKVKVMGETMDGYHVFVGGGFGQNKTIGRQVFTGISFDQLKPTLEKMLRGFLRHRQTGESFLNFTKRHDLNSLQVIFSNEE